MENSKRGIQYLIDVANIITPPNWNVYIHPESRNTRPGTLNVWLSIHGEYNEDENSNWDDDWIGQKAGSQKYSKISSMHNAPTGAERSMNKNHGVIADTEIWLREGWLNLDILFHELTHVVVERFLAWKQKRYRFENTGGEVADTEEDSHGLSFLRAYRILIKRAEKYLLCEEVGQIKADMHIYEKDDPLVD